jgi:teichuronic acid biosynthesis glycosyltransferase TuaC
MRVLAVTAMYPSEANLARGTFVKEQVDSLRDAGIEVDVLAFMQDKGGGYLRRVIYYLQAIRTMRRQLRAKRYDVVHAYYGVTGVVARMQTRCPLVVTFLGSDLLSKIRFSSWNALRGTFEVLISKLVALTSTKRIIVANNLKPKLWPLSTMTIPMGVDLSLFKPKPTQAARKQLGLALDKRLVLFPAHPNNYVKRFDIAQAAVRLLAETLPDVELIALQGFARSEVPLYMNACDALVLTSMHEAAPCVIKEAMACNLPIVSVNVGDVAEYIDGVEGCYLCDRTPQDVAVKLRKVLGNGRRTDGREKMQTLSLQSVARKVIAVYEDTLAIHSRV